MKLPKYRAWDKDMQQMLQVNQLFLHPTTTNFGLGIIDEHNDFHPIDEIELLAYTTFNDKNDDDIYDGDFLTDDKGDLYQVFYNKNIHNWDVHKIDHLPGVYMGFLYSINRSSKITGNIYQHPHLLENKA
jgi:hypothetical protein